MLLEKINKPSDIKTFTADELNTLAGEMRDALLFKLSRHGGHCGPNLGMVEAVIALHYVFDSPVDKMVFDVSHQSYCHKMLTGRKDAFLYADHLDDVSGYTEPSESEHDFFTIGHTSTSISLASGLAKARDLKGEKGNVIAVIGDGSLSGGEAMEGLDFAGEMKGNFIIVVNDNDMSIAENHGGIYQNLRLLRETKGKSECNLFRAMGLDYVFVENGNDIPSLIDAFRCVKDSTIPVVVHIVTEKGRGYAPAVANKEQWHWCMPFDPETGKPLFTADGEDYGTITADFLMKKMKADKSVCAITSGTPMVMGFDAQKRKEAGSQFIDVGIAEEHAVALASGIAANGGKPFYGVYSSFVQRTYDQMSQDLCINNNPALILVFWGGASTMNDVTHLCLFDIPVIGNIPNMVYLAPTCREEYFAMLEWGIHQTEHPVAIRVPANGVLSRGIEPEKDYGKLLNRYEVAYRGGQVAVLGLGSFFQLGEEVVGKLKEETGVDATLVNPRFITGVDEALLEDLKRDHTLVVTLEDGVLDGGFGEKIARYYGTSGMKVLNYGIRKEFADRYDAGELLRDNRLTVPQIVEDIKKVR